MPYIDGFVIAVPSANKDKFLAHARQMDPIFLELGATRVIEGWGDDVPRARSPTFGAPCKPLRMRRWLFRGWNGPTRQRAMPP